jgi:hypothetical protein
MLLTKFIVRPSPDREYHSTFRIADAATGGAGLLGIGFADFSYPSVIAARPQQRLRSTHLTESKTRVM